MRTHAALAITLALAACGGGAKKPTTVDHTVTGEPSGSATAEPPGDARVIQRTQMGGTIELIGNRNDSMVAATKEMEAHCGPSAFTITQEGEEVIGDSDAMPAQTAWRVYYSCTGAGLPPPPAAP